MVSEQESGYICGFSIYTGKSSNKLVSADATLDKDCSITTKTVMGLLQRTRLLDNHRTVFFDNYFRFTNFTIVVFMFFKNIPAYFEI